MPPQHDKISIAEMVNDSSGRTSSIMVWGNIYGLLGAIGFLHHCAAAVFPALRPPMISVEYCFALFGIQGVYFGVRRLTKDKPVTMVKTTDI